MFTETIANYRFGIAEPLELDEVRRFHHDMFLESGYIAKSSPTGMIEDSRIDVSIYFYCRDMNGEVIGVIRQINGSGLGLPTIDDFKLWPEQKVFINRILWPKIVEIGSLAVNRNHNKVAEGLYRQIWQQSKRAQHSYWIASIDNRLLRSLRSRRGFLWVDVGDSKLYMGSDTTPVIADLREQMINMRERAPRFFDYINNPVPPDYLYLSM